MSVKHLLLCAAMACGLAAVPVAMAMETSDLNSPTPASQTTTSGQNDLTIAPADSPAGVLYADDTGGPNIHGFATETLSTDYITPRGLVVADEDLVMQPIVGLVFPIGDIGPLKNFTFVGGIWNCIAYQNDDAHVGAWNELDDFFSVSFDPLQNFSMTATYVAFNSPTGAYKTEHNSDLKTSYDDSSLWGGNFGIHPYVDLWWAMAGSSTVVLGKPGETGYLEPGVVPTYTLKCLPSYPITLTLPTHLSIGPKDYWQYKSDGPTGGTWGGGNVGVFTTAFDASVPLSFIPVKYGYWHADAAINYFDLINNSLLASGTIVSGNTRRDLFMGTFSIGVNF